MAGGDGDGVEATICAREFEIHVDLVVEPGAKQRAAALADSFASKLGRYLFGEDERTIAEIVLDLCRARGLTLATAESCTGGMVAARLTGIPGSSDVFVGSVVAYANAVKTSELGVPRGSPRAPRSGLGGDCGCHGCRRAGRLGADVGVAVTGVADPTAGPRGSPWASSSSTRSARTGRRRAGRSSPATGT